MARPRSSLTALGKLLDAIGQPLYVLDADRKLVWANEATAAWTNLALDDLLGQRCDYHSSPADSIPADRQALAGLCPPPEAFGGVPVEGDVWTTTSAGTTSTRSARFLPLGATPEGCEGVLVLVAAEETDNDRATGPGTAIEPDALALHRAVRQFRQSQRRRYALDALVGHSPAIVRARAQIETAAAGDAHVFVLGPSGSGRSHVARTIHYHRRGQAVGGVDDPTGGALLVLSCTSLGPERLQAAITSLVRRAASAPERIPGTLVLQDIEQLPADAQLELSGFLTLASFRMRVIATGSVQADVLAGEGRLRPDLAFALTTLVVELPPLAERREDILLVAQALLEDQNARGGVQRQGFRPEALDALAGYPWPGNVDELAEMIRHAHGQSDAPLVAVDELPPRIRQAEEAARYPRAGEAPIALEELLGRIETELIRRALAQAKGNKTRAAELLGLNRPRLYRRMQQLGLTDEADNQESTEA